MRVQFRFVSIFYDISQQINIIPFLSSANSKGLDTAYASKLFKTKMNWRAKRFSTVLTFGTRNKTRLVCLQKKFIMITDLSRMFLLYKILSSKNKFHSVLFTKQYTNSLNP